MKEERQGRITLNRFLVERQHLHPDATGELTRVMDRLGTVGKIISNYMKCAALDGLRGLTGAVNVQGENVQKLDELGNSVFIEAFEYVDIVGAIVSEEMEKPLVTSLENTSGKYLVLIDPIDGSSNLEVDCTIGSIFSVRKIKNSIEETVLQKGSEQVAAGYIMYGTSTHLIYSAGDGVHGFVLDEPIGEFVLDHEYMRMPEKGKIVSSNFGNYRKWSASARHFSDAILAGEDSYSLRYSGALVADLHQILHFGGIYFYPDETKRPEGKLRLLYECAPLAMIAEQAGGSATTGRVRIMDIGPSNIHQRIPFAIGSIREIQKYEEAYAI